MIINLVTDRFCLGGGLEHIFQIIKGMEEVDFRVYARPSYDNRPGESERVKQKFRELKNVILDEGGFGPETVLKNKPDIVHIHHLRPLFYFFRNPLKKYRIPVMFTVHGLHLHKYEFYPHHISDMVGNKIKYLLRFILERRLFGQVNRVIAVSRDDKHFMEHHYRLRNVTYLTNGINISDVRISDVSRSELRRSLGLPPDHFLFVTVARFNFQKAYDFMIKTLCLLTDFLKNRKIKFIFVGGGTELNRIKKMADNLRVSSYITFTGERSDARQYIKSADVFLLPSRWEGLPIVLLECGLFRVPVIVSDTYGNREIIKKNNGVLFKNLDSPALAEVIKKAVNGEYKWEQMTTNLDREVKQNYSIEKMLTGLREIYNSYST